MDMEKDRKEARKRKVTYVTVRDGIADAYRRLEVLGEDFRLLYGVSGENLRAAIKDGSERIGIANTMLLALLGELDDARSRDCASEVANRIINY